MKGPFSEKAPPKTEGEVVTFETVLKAIHNRFELFRQEYAVPHSLLVDDCETDIRDNVVALQTQLQELETWIDTRWKHGAFSYERPVSYTDYECFITELLTKIKNVLGCVEAKEK